MRFCFQREWPDGAMLRHSIGYSLPTSVTGKGLTAAGLDASSEAKGLIMELLTWSPEKRLSADLVNLTFVQPHLDND